MSCANNFKLILNDDEKISKKEVFRFIDSLKKEKRKFQATIYLTFFYLCQTNLYHFNISKQKIQIQN